MAKAHMSKKGLGGLAGLAGGHGGKTGVKGPSATALPVMQDPMPYYQPYSAPSTYGSAPTAYGSSAYSSQSNNIAPAMSAPPIQSASPLNLPAHTNHKGMHKASVPSPLSVLSSPTHFVNMPVYHTVAVPVQQAMAVPVAMVPVRSSEKSKGKGQGSGFGGLGIQSLMDNALSGIIHGKKGSKHQNALPSGLLPQGNQANHAPATQYYMASPPATYGNPSQGYDVTNPLYGVQMPAYSPPTIKSYKPSSSYAPQNPEYPTQSSNYAPQAPAYSPPTPELPSYAQQDPVYPIQSSNYAPKASAYAPQPPAPPSYGQQNPGYPTQSSSYTSQSSAYAPQPPVSQSYAQPDPVYPPQTSSYGQQVSGYSPQSSAYDPQIQDPAYDSSASSYGPQPPGYATSTADFFASQPASFSNQMPGFQNQMIDVPTAKSPFSSSFVDSAPSPSIDFSGAAGLTTGAASGYNPMAPSSSSSSLGFNGTPVNSPFGAGSQLSSLAPSDFTSNSQFTQSVSSGQWSNSESLAPAETAQSLSNESALQNPW
ncbi:hypothetical protein QYM36_015220 [Artemia franciscana]|nr:hypothetical protein QYM36_015220 [Artemia franciscana]